jgi:hypothetical protein
MCRQMHISTLTAAIIPWTPWCHPACAKVYNNQLRPSADCFCQGRQCQVVMGCHYCSRQMSSFSVLVVSSFVVT